MYKILKASGLFLLAFSVYLPVNAQIVSSFKELNSPYDEHHPVVSPNGDLYFSVGFHPDNKGGASDFGDIWRSTKDKNGNWSKPQRVVSLSTSGNDVVVGFPDPVSILVYHEGNGINQGIHQYSKFGNSYNYLRPLEMGNFKNNSKYFGGRLSKDGKTIVMSIDSYGTFGNEDLYVSFKKSVNEWTSPLNLGEIVNSYGQEQTPYLSDDQRILYFSANAGGKGRGKDIFFTERLDDTWTSWTSPKAIRYANSTGTEMGYVPLSSSDSSAIFSSTQNSEGFGDLMTVKFDNISPQRELANVAPEELMEEEQVALAEITQVDEVLSETIVQEEDLLLAVENDSIPEVDEIYVQNDDKEIDEQTQSKFELVRILSANEREEIAYTLFLINNRGDRKEMEDQNMLLEDLNKEEWVSILVSSKGYLPSNMTASEWSDLPNNELLMQPASAGARIVLDNIQFNRGTSDFADSRSIQVLDQLVLFLKENEAVKIRLEGHTDNAGDPVLNKDLSLKRASKIRGYLTLNGIQFERIRISGWGGTRPIADNSTDEGRNINRRVELTIEG
ncbi:OmpA family protein [Mongoliibacter sp.]|uniref:OmpA family protein n=1 Tax=Mongoliibacter sp. TaxID=2022438 RepID=UPI0025D03844|nr:OmpA family protein [Mongoliibacter sp.]